MGVIRGPDNEKKDFKEIFIFGDLVEDFLLLIIIILQI